MRGVDQQHLDAKGAQSLAGPSGGDLAAQMDGVQAVGGALLRGEDGKWLTGGACGEGNLATMAGLMDQTCRDVGDGADGGLNAFPSLQRAASGDGQLCRVGSSASFSLAA